MRYESSFSFDVALLVPYVVIISPLWNIETGLYSVRVEYQT